jgi:hypothetical protein
MEEAVFNQVLVIVQTYILELASVHIRQEHLSASGISKRCICYFIDYKK